MIYLANIGLCYVAQIMVRIGQPEGGEPKMERGSEAIPLIIGAVVILGIVAIAFRGSKRDRVQSS